MISTAIAGKVSIKKNDEVQVMAGREKGKIGKVLRVSIKTGRITIEKVNMVKKHVKPSQKNPQGGVLEQEASIHFSNVLLHCLKCSRGVRHGVKWIEASAPKKGAKAAADGQKKKVRVCKRCDSSLDAT